MTFILKQKNHPLGSRL